jgi:hypothetical protein
VAQLRDVEPELERRGVPLYLIGSGEPRHLAPFREKLGVRSAIYLDAERASFRAAGLRRGALESIHPRALPRAVASLFKGHGFPVLQGDPWQQGGALVLDARGPEAPKVLLHQVSRHVSDLVENAELIDALDR